MLRPGAMLLKLYAYLQSPFERTLFLDTDVFVLQPDLVDSLLMHTLRFTDLAAPVDPAHTNPPATHAPLMCMGLAAFRRNAATRMLFVGSVLRMAQRHAQQRRAAGGLGRNGDQEAIYEEWTQGESRSLRMLPLTEEYYCPQVPLHADGRSAVWSTSWTSMGKFGAQPYQCKAVHGHSYHSQRAC